MSLKDIVFFYMEINKIKNIYDFVTSERTEYENPKGVELEDGWNWSMKEHIRRSYLYMNSQFLEDNSDRYLRPFRNIILPILNIQFRLEGFDVKDIELYVNNPDKYYKSLLVRKFHNKWALEEGIDTFIDEMVESYGTYGGVLVRKRAKNARPEVVDFRTLAFCNQTDILAYPFAIRHVFSPAQLRKASDKWGDGSYGATIDIETLISKAKQEDKKEIEVFEVHGVMPTEWLDDKETAKKDVNQVQVVSFYKDENSQEVGSCLFKHEEPDLPFKFLSRDEINGRALGRGGVEELFEPQQWTNKAEIATSEMLDSASKTIHWTDDRALKTKNLKNVKNSEILGLTPNTKLNQLDTQPRNLVAFNDSIERWWQHAQTVGSAPDPVMGETPTAGTPFKSYEAQQIEGKGMHKYRQGKLAVFMDEIYRDWILPHLAKEICNEQEFLEELSADEMEEVVDKVVTSKTNEFKKRMILGLQEINEDIIEMYKQEVRKDFVKKGNKRFFEILKDEMKDISLSVSTNIAGKQKNLALLTDKLVNVFRQFIATPQLRQDPEMVKLFNQILETSGLEPINFSPLPVAQPQTMPQQGGQPPMQTGGMMSGQSNQQ
jgi:hypothetical protein